ncbi:ChbG/HpnK family deacetylase [Variovorax sp. H27-G14]|uniref:ChbG/HpnK family deacetylase n=1 Tax=Variovorax sp. H27-G14 TaxID=3111914 RepID=UPI0038FC8081
MTEAHDASAPPGRHICICADDFGLSTGVNIAVVDLAQRGKISATSGMVRRSAWLAGAQALRRIAPARLDVGLHLDLTRPLRVDGPEPGLAGLLAQTYTRTVFAAGLKADIRDQLTRFEDAMGRAPAFIDGHRHVHQFPVVRDLLVEEVARRYPTAPPWLRGTAPAARQGPDRWKASLIYALGGARLAAAAARHGIPTSRHLLGVYDFSGDAHGYAQRLAGWLAACTTGDVLMCHPAAGILPSDPHGAARLREYAVLRDLALPLPGLPGGLWLSPLSALFRRGPLAPAWSGRPVA